MKNHDSRETGPGKLAGTPQAFAVWPRVLLGLALTVFLVIGCGGWAVMARLDGAVIGSGIVKVDQNLKDVQHRDGGIIKTLAVRPGDG